MKFREKMRYFLDKTSNGRKRLIIFQEKANTGHSIFYEENFLKGQRKWDLNWINDRLRNYGAREIDKKRARTIYPNV